jgi:hypothetical protein
MLRAVGLGAAWCFLRVTRPLLFALRREAAVFREVVFFALRLEVFLSFAEASVPLPDVFFLTVFFVVFEWVAFFVVCAITRSFGTTIIPISRHPTTTVIEILAQLCNIVSLFFQPTSLL